MKKTITITLIVILLINLISIPCFAEQPDFEEISTKPQETGQVEITNADGQKTTTGITGQTYSGSTTFKVIANVLTALPQFVNEVMDKFVETTSKDDNVKKFTIYDTVMGNYDLFNLNYIDVPENQADSTNLFQFITVHVLKYYSITRNLSLALSLLVLIYIGVRMAITTVSSEQAKYKKMLVNWVASVVLIFVLHLFIITVSFLMQKGFQLVDKIATLWQIKGFEEQIYSGAIKNLSSHGFNMFTTVVIIYILTWYQAKFFLYYLNRTLEVNFLVIVAPLVTVTYSIDKAGDNKAQALGNFVREITMKSFIQLIHAVLYIVFIATAGVIAVSQPIIAIVFFAALSRAEKITKNIFSVKDKGMADIKIPFAEDKI